MDDATRGAFLFLAINGATTLIGKMVANQCQGEERKQHKGVHTVEEADMLVAK
jgi:hypothetical protein